MDDGLVKVWTKARGRKGQEQSEGAGPAGGPRPGRGTRRPGSSLQWEWEGWAGHQAKVMENSPGRRTHVGFHSRKESGSQSLKLFPLPQKQLTVCGNKWCVFKAFVEGEAAVRGGRELRRRFPARRGVTLCTGATRGAAAASLAPACPAPLLWRRDPCRDADCDLLRGKTTSLSVSLTFWERLLGPAGSLGPGVVRGMSLGVRRTPKGRGVLVLIPVSPGGNSKALRCLQSRLGLGYRRPAKEMSWALTSWLDRPCWACWLSLSLCSKWCQGMWGTSDSS